MLQHHVINVQINSIDIFSICNSEGSNPDSHFVLLFIYFLRYYCHYCYY